MLVDDGDVADRQTLSGALAGGFRGEERIEDPSLNRLGDTRPIIGHENLDPIVVSARRHDDRPKRPG